jgi:putative addiction module component (TIGR02574 family)
MIAETIPGLKDLSQDQKIILAAELWRDAVGVAEDKPDPELVAALNERLDHYRANPNQVATWEDVRARLISRKD